ncbi:MAG: hypothetical protein MZV63_14990 [Marinilabiliales bacterium]|nr:hypothetical protein [Marinilabiliales bacterium]
MKYPVNHRKREFGKSKYGIERYLERILGPLNCKNGYTLCKKSALPVWQSRHDVNPVAILVTGYLTVLKLFYGQALTNRPLLFLGILLILAGLQFFSMGLISELLINRSQAGIRQVSVRETLNTDCET